MTTINRRNFLKIGVAAGIGLALPRGVMAQVTPPPPTPEVTPPHLLERRVTIADRQAAVANAKAAGLKPGAASGMAAMGPSPVPHYFGPFANYANSPLPKGGIASIVVDNAGNGYSATPTVTIEDVYGTGSGATALAVVVGGNLISISVTNPGSLYSAPIVSIVDATGSGAAATAVLAGPFVGGIRKFVDSMAGIDPLSPNTLGQYIPVAVADKTTYANCDYYEIAVVQYRQQMHSDLPLTLLRGYVQLSTSVVPGASVPLTNAMPDGTDVPIAGFTGVDNPHYLGPLIVASKDRPVRIKFRNLLPTGMDGNLFIPVDKTVMGAGMGPVAMPGMPDMMEEYTQNRATLHLHGGLVPWISDGTPHQWITPAGEDTPYPQGVSVVPVPDMADDTGDPRDGVMTFYYNNQQSARLMFYHDHAYGITRLNVYAGEAAGYLLTDEVEQDLINGTNVSDVNPGLAQILPGIGIPLIIQDKTFVDETTIPMQDPMWRWGTGAVMDPMTGDRAPKTGDLWVPNVYMPAQNPWDPSGASAFGRWQYGPWFWPPTSNIDFMPVPNEYFGDNPWEPPMRPQMPFPSMGMEAFNDTPLVNGTVYPYLEVNPAPVRFRILNAANDRFFNLQFYEADPDVVSVDERSNTEVKMVPAVTTPGFPATWSTDGRAGGVPDPATAGPSWIQIGNEGGFLPAPVVIPPQPINWNMNATAFNVGNVTDHSLLLGCAERADVIVDFSPYAGKTLILYNDAPAAFPALDPRYDYYTGDPDQTDAGGAPTTQPGYGPNTRTIMQIRVGGVTAGVPVAGIALRSGGADYTTAPTVVIEGGGGTGATATASCSLDHITMTSTGSGYGTTPFDVTIEAPTMLGGVQATARANLTNGRVTSITITNPGSGYVTAPLVTVGGTGTGAVAVSAMVVSAVSLDAAGDGYTSIPAVRLEGGGGYGAIAAASLALSGVAYDLPALEAVWALAPGKRGVFERAQDPIILPQAVYNSAYGINVPDTMAQYVQLHDFTKTFFSGGLTGIQLTAPGSGYTEVPTVSITGGGGTGAVATATIQSSRVNGVTLTGGGSGYTSNPAVVFSVPAGQSGSGATATAVIRRAVVSVTVTNPGTGYNNNVRVTISGGGGTGATARANLGAGGSIASITVLNGGNGYTSNPTVSIQGGGGRNATATARADGFVNTINLTNGGSGYTIVPTVTLTGGGAGVNPAATATATIEAGFVTGVTLTNFGSGFISAPTVTLTGGGPAVTQTATATALGITLPLEPKAIHDEMGAAYDVEYGRMGGMLGLELPVVNSLNQNMVLYGYATPPVDLMRNSMTPLGTLRDGTQIWKITQNGVDTHPMHFHLFNVQVINRVAWDGAMLPPDPNEVGWKETVRTNPLEHLIVAMRPVAPTQPFDLPNSIRAIDPTMPIGMTLRGGPNGFVDPGGTAAPVVNHLVNFGWEYVWHCHILSHEEMDMMHPLVFGMEPAAPVPGTPPAVYFNSGPRRVRLTWTDSSTNETGFTVERSLSQTGPWTLLATLPAVNGKGSPVNYTDTSVQTNRTYFYRVTAINVIGDTTTYTAPAIGYPNRTMRSAPIGISITTSTNAGPGTPFIFASTFNDGLAGWSGVVGNVVVGPQPAMAQAAAGDNLVMIATIGQDPAGQTAQPAYVFDHTPENDELYTASFLFDPYTGNSGDGPVDVFVGLDQNGQPVLGVQFERDEADPTKVEVRGWFLANGQQVFTDMVELAAGMNLIDLAWRSGADGHFSLYVGEQHIKTLRGDTSASKLDAVLLGPSMGLSKSSSGVMLFDEFTSSRILAGMTNKLFLGWLSR